MNEVSTIIISLAFLLAIGIIAYFRNPSGVMAELKAAAEMAVAKAEQTLPGATNEQKLAAVIQWIAETGKFDNISESVINTAVEGAVWILKKSHVSVGAGNMLNTIETEMNPPKYDEHDAVTKVE